MPIEAGCTTPDANALRLSDDPAGRRKGPGLITTDFGKRRRPLGGLLVAVFPGGVLLVTLSGVAYNGLVAGLASATTAGAADEGKFTRGRLWLAFSGCEGRTDGACSVIGDSARRAREPLKCRAAAGEGFRVTRAWGLSVRLAAAVVSSWLSLAGKFGDGTICSDASV